MKIVPGVILKPSVYFADKFRYFFKRFYKKQTLTRWFLKRAGEESGCFNFPDALKENPRTLLFLPRDIEGAAGFLHSMPQAWFKNVMICAHESLHSLVLSKRAKAVFFSDSECRFGENHFSEMERSFVQFAPTVCIYLGKPFLPRLYLAKKSGASCRIGFSCEELYPFLNLSLHINQSSPASLIADYYGRYELRVQQ